MTTNEIMAAVKAIKVGDDVTVDGLRVCKYACKNYVVFQDGTPIRGGIQTPYEVAMYVRNLHSSDTSTDAYQIREYPNGQPSTPTDRGILVSEHATWREAADKAARLAHEGRAVYACRAIEAQAAVRL